MKTLSWQGDTLDSLCLRHYGRTQGVFETVLAANPGLAEMGAILAHGTVVELPEVPPAPTTQSINLWD